MPAHDNPSILTTVMSTWTRAPGKDVAAPLLEINLARRADYGGNESVVEEIHLEPPRAWKPGMVFIGHDTHKLNELKPGSTLINDSRSVSWEVSQRITRDTWTLILSSTKPDVPLPNDWALTVAILLEKPGAQSQGDLVVDVDGARQTIPFAITPDASPPRWTVRLETDPAETNALVRGQELILRWEVENIEGDAELRGSLPGANTIRIPDRDKGQRTVRALDESVYSLTATVKHEGQLIEVVRRVHVNLEAPQYGLNLEFVPAVVFPGGPIVCYRSAYNVKNIKFTRSGDEPSLAAHNYSGKETTIVGTFVVPFGPREKQTWAPGAVYSSPQGEKRAQGNHIKGIAPTAAQNSMFYNLPVSFGTETRVIIHGLAAGAYIVQSDDPDPQIAKREWIAIATTTGLELWARDPVYGEVQPTAALISRKWTNKWLEGALAGEFLGVGAAADSNLPDIQCIVGVRRNADESEVAEVIEIDFPLREDNEYRKVLAIADARFVRGPVRVVSIACRVFLFGAGAAISYERNMRTTTFRDERRLTMVAYPEWEVVGITAERRPSDAPTAPIGYLFALEKRSGILLRFDVHDGIVSAPRMAARGNDKIARLDALQKAQACLSPSPPPFPREELEDGRGYTGKDTDGSILEYLNPITEHSSMIVLGGALLVRSEVVDPSVGQIIQDRAYDPRLDVWVRCGHPFVQANGQTTNHFASTAASLYCLVDDVLLYIEGALPSYLGFMSSDFTPIDAGALAMPPWPASFIWPTIDNKTSLELQWPDGRLGTKMFEEGRLCLTLLADAATIITIDVDINRETGKIEKAKAHVDTTRREVALCRWDSHALTIEPMTWPLGINIDKGLVLPFSYHITGRHLEAIHGEASTGSTLSIPSITGESRCCLEFKYLGGDPRASTLDARAELFMVNGKVADFQWAGKHSSLFDVEIEDGHILQLSLQK